MFKNTSPIEKIARIFKKKIDETYAIIINKHINHNYKTSYMHICNMNMLIYSSLKDYIKPFNSFIIL